MLMQRLLSTASAAAFVVLPSLVSAEAVLTVATPEQSTSFTLEELLAMPQAVVVTSNDYVDRSAKFQGPLLRTILNMFGIDREEDLNMIALNDFTSTVPASDAFDYDVVLAVLRDGEPMTVRNKGPIWVIYPMDDNPELHNDTYNDRLVWQLKEISVE
ncbi:molybdopterin-dependent oxidoreductase [Sulfitobacter sp. R18_1]|uniref:molybdopterin-dependent oxidoreductase n=1 Tax=Sulfitobacter sp. R18_1 TaxID=2821104 RepID=UPI001ADC096E|nr:molybdopterin-dependent oxidoreductase [Sulfitobacter sp. R18_1]MBO9432455.1 molybdopterin-dependent oxidoreductase [Sulfitobacter sp. R18_1]